jgi:hypothetical protein
MSNALSPELLNVINSNFPAFIAAIKNKLNTGCSNRNARDIAASLFGVDEWQKLKGKVSNREFEIKHFVYDIEKLKVKMEKSEISLAVVAGIIGKSYTSLKLHFDGYLNPHSDAVRKTFVEMVDAIGCDLSDFMPEINSADQSKETPHIIAKTKTRFINIHSKEGQDVLSRIDNVAPKELPTVLFVESDSGLTVEGEKSIAQATEASRSKLSSKQATLKHELSETAKLINKLGDQNNMSEVNRELLSQLLDSFHKVETTFRERNKPEPN